MKRAVIFDMFETLITHYHNQAALYFGTQIAQDAGIAEEKFRLSWRGMEKERTIGKKSLEEVLEIILRENDCYSQELLNQIVEKRVMTAETCFLHLHLEIIPMFLELKRKGILIGLISNCFSEEAEVIRRSILFPYFDAVFLSYEQGVQKPDVEIFQRCVDKLSVKPEECVYVGDGGSFELEAAKDFGMTAVRAVWYLKEEAGQILKRKHEFLQAETPLEVIKYLK